MTYDRAWLFSIAECKRTISLLRNDLLPQVSNINHRFSINEAFSAVAQRFGTHLQDGRCVADDLQDLIELASLADKLIEEEEKQCAAYSSQAHAT